MGCAPSVGLIRCAAGTLVALGRLCRGIISESSTGTSCRPTAL
jgi:hypothetical protein